MLRKILKLGFFSGVVLVGGSYIFPDQFLPVTKVLNIGIAGAKVYWVYKYT
jgi:hypothetical protein